MTALTLPSAWRNDPELIALYKQLTDNVVLVPITSKAALPALRTGSLVFVIDEAGGAVLAFCDGTNWRRVTDRAVVS